RPHARGEEKFGVGALPEHEIAQATFASGANEKINVRGGSSGVGDVAEAASEFALRDFEARKHPARGAKDSVAGGIIEGDAKFHGASGGGGAFGELDGVHKAGWYAIAATDDAQANVRSSACGSVVAQKIFEQAEQRVNFVAGARPIVGRE